MRADEKIITIMVAVAAKMLISTAMTISSTAFAATADIAASFSRTFSFRDDGSITCLRGVLCLCVHSRMKRKCETLSHSHNSKHTLRLLFVIYWKQ